MMYQFNSKDIVRDNNRFLLEKIKNIEESIRNLQNQGSPVETLSNFDDDSYDEGPMRCENSNDESYAEFKNRLMAIEELTQIKFKNYTSKNVSAQQGLPPGLYREVETDVVFFDYLEASISFIEDINDNTKPVLFMNWQVSETLAQTELAPLAGVLKKDLLGLFAKLGEYAQLALDRFELISEFCRNNEGHCLLQTKKQGLTLKWRDGLFKLVWNLQLSQYEEVVNVLHIYIDEKEVQFIRASSSILEQLTDLNQTSSERRVALMELGKCALRH